MCVWGGGGGQTRISLVHWNIITHFYPAALKGSGVLSYPERTDGRAGGRADKPR